MPMTKSPVVAVGLALVMATTVARAQEPPPGGPPPGMRGGPGGPGRQSLVMNAAVQEELGLSEKQKAQLGKIESTTRQKHREAFEGGAGGDPQEMQAAMNALRRQQDAAVARALDRRQKERLAQIDLPREGLLAVARTDVASRLKLTSAQTRKIKAIVDEMRRSQARSMPRPPGGPGQGPGGGPPPGFGGPGNDDQSPGDGPGQRGGPPPGGPPGMDDEAFRAQFARVREQQEKIRDAAAEKIAKILNKDQAAAFDKILGTPFDLSKLRPGRGPGGPPPGGPPSDANPRRGAAR